MQLGLLPDTLRNYLRKIVSRPVTLDLTDQKHLQEGEI